MVGTSNAAFVITSTTNPLASRRELDDGDLIEAVAHDLERPAVKQDPVAGLRYGGSASRWGFAIYRASHHDYQDNVLPSGEFAGTPEEALDCACGLYLNDSTAWRSSPTNSQPWPLVS